MTNEEKVYNTCLQQGIPNDLALLVVAQSKHESDDYTSGIFTHCNNSFGYKTGGYVTGCSFNSDYRPYSNIEGSTIEICNWLKRRVIDGSFPDLYSITTAEQYASLLKNAGYYGDSYTNYLAGLKRWFNDNLSIITASSTGLLIAAIFFF